MSKDDSLQQTHERHKKLKKLKIDQNVDWMGVRERISLIFPLGEKMVTCSQMASQDKRALVTRLSDNAEFWFCHVDIEEQMRSVAQGQ